MAKHRKEESQEPQTQGSLEAKIAALMMNVTDIVQEATKTQKQLELANKKEALQKEKEEQERIAAEEKAALLKEAQELVPAHTDKNISKNLKIEFLIHHTVPLSGPGALVAPGFGAAHKVYSLLQKMDEKAKVTGRLFGATLTNDNLPVVALDTAEGYKAASARGNSFEAVAGRIMSDSSTGQARGKNYIIITNGVLSGNIAQWAYALEALKLNPKATVDFVVVNPEKKTDIDALLEKLKGTPAKKQINVIKVSKAEEITAGVKRAVRTRVAALNVAAESRKIAQKASKSAERVKPENPSYTRSLVERMRAQRAAAGKKPAV